MWSDIKKLRGIGSAKEEEQIVILNRVDIVGFIEKVIFKQSLKAGEMLNTHLLITQMNETKVKEAEKYKGCSGGGEKMSWEGRLLEMNWEGDGRLTKKAAELKGMNLQNLEFTKNFHL